MDVERQSNIDATGATMPNTTASSCSDPKAVLRYLFDLSESAGGFANLSTFSPAIYDTAWLSMVYKYDAATPYCVFPECFEHVLETQQHDGTWTTYGAPVDSIVNSLSALLSIAKNAAAIPVNRTRYDLDRKIQLAKQGNDRLLQTWDVSATTHVGFEVIVTSLLRQLKELDISFTFSRYNELKGLYEQKMKRFVPMLIYSKQQTSILHSAEGLIGVIDFDKISHHCNATSGIFGSPAATAAYLANATEWDHRAEMYLRRVLQCYGNGRQVPSAYPTSMFEVSWATSLLLSVKPSLDGQDQRILSSIRDFLDDTLQIQNGITGFAPGVLDDADDTARVLITLRRLGQDIDPRPMIKAFETSTHFKTYDLERNPSFTTNCNVLIALLESSSIETFSTQILKTLEFLIRYWDSDQISDKWNVSPAYSFMLLSEALSLVLKRYHEGQSWILSGQSSLGKIATVLCQVLQQVLKNQTKDGSWEQSLEATSYNILTLAQLSCLPWSEALRTQIRKSLEKGQNYVAASSSVEQADRCLWIEKTTFRIETLSRAYCAAAVAAKELFYSWDSKVQAIFALPPKAVKQAGAMLGNLPLFKKSPLRNLELILLQSQWYSKALEKHRNDLYTRDHLPMKEGKYLQFIPLIWLTCNSISDESLSSDVIFAMSKMSLYIYQIDELMESIAAELDEERLENVLASLRRHCKLEDHAPAERVTPTKTDDDCPPQDPSAESMLSGLDQFLSSHTSSSSPSSSDADLATDIVAILTKFIDKVLEDPAVKRSPLSVQKSVAIDVYQFIKAHRDHNSDNAAWSRAKASQQAFTPTDVSRGGNFYGWITSTASADTSCPFAFRFFSCLIGQYFASPEAAFYSQGVAKHLSVMCRLYNDWGSAERDSAEGNLNSLDFAEFNDSREKKDSLMTIASFERECLDLAMERLEKIIQPAASMELIRAFVNVTDLFGQMYVQKDLSSTKEKSKL